MLHVDKVLIILATLTWNLGMTEAEAVKRDLIGRQSGLEFLHLGTFGPLSELSSHPTFSRLGLNSQQTVGFVNVLLQNGLLSPHALRRPDGQPLAGAFGFPLGPASVFGYPGFMIDPYFLFLLSNHQGFLPFGLGPQGIYGSTGLPKPRPLGVFKYNDKN